MGDRLDELPVVANGFACAPPPGDDAVDSSAWDHVDICPSDIYFSSLPRSKAKNHRAGAHFPSYYPWWQWMETLCMRKNLAAQCVLDG